MSHVERFAPSPTGPLHLGHAFSALTAWERSLAEGGDFLLRIEDIDQERSRPEWEAQIFDDLRWLGIWWPEPVLRQSERAAAYRTALERLWERDLLYVCACTRRDIRDALSAPQDGALPTGPDGLIYPGTCRPRFPGVDGPMPLNATLRLDLDLATAFLGEHRVSTTPHWQYFLRFKETGPAHAGLVEFEPKSLMDTCGDIVLARAGWGTSYHLAVVLDDAHQGVTHVTRGEDLFEATKIHVLLQTLLDLPTPVYHHHRLIRDAAGKRLAKRDDSKAISKFRAEGASPADIRAMVGLDADLVAK